MDTESATPCGNSELSTSACTRSVGVGVLAAGADVVLSCCNAAAPSPPAFEPEPPASPESPAPPRACPLPSVLAARVASAATEGDGAGVVGALGIGVPWGPLTGAVVAALAACTAAAPAPVASDPSIRA